MCGDAQRKNIAGAAGRQMSASGMLIMQDTLPLRNGPPRGGAVTFATAILAANSAAVLVALSGCHSTPPTSGFVSSAADKSVEQRLQPADGMKPLQPFDEGFYVPPPDAESP
jgi:hypothetical protein